MKPTIAELGALAIETEIDLDAEAFHDHFESNGWRVGGKAPMKDWREAARNWARRELEFQRGGTATQDDPRGNLALLAKMNGEAQ